MDMKRPVLLICTALVVIASCKSKTDAVSVLQSSLTDQVHQIDTANYTLIEWIDSAKNFGTVTKGEKVKVDFRFKNAGDKPLFLASVRPSCGCTVADYTKGAILPGQEGAVKAEFDSNHGFPGHIRKSINVTSNSKNKPIFNLVFEGEVKEKTTN